MEGVVLNFDEKTHIGVIRAVDGRRYGFADADWLGKALPQSGDQIDFEIADRVAIDIYLTRAASRLSVDRVVQSLAGSLAKASAAGSRLGASSSARGWLPLDNWSVVFAVVSILLCFAPLVGVGSQSVNLFGTASFIGSAQDGLNQMNAQSYLVYGHAGRIPAGMAGYFEISPLTSLWLDFAYLVYAIPLCAIWIVVGAWQRKPSGPACVAHALACAWPLVLLIGSSALLPPDLNAPGMGRLALFSPFSIVGWGVWGFVMLGGAQVASLKGVFRGNPSRILRPLTA
jgi:hypothetical protein